MPRGQGLVAARRRLRTKDSACSASPCPASPFRCRGWTRHSAIFGWQPSPSSRQGCCSGLLPMRSTMRGEWAPSVSDAFSLATLILSRQLSTQPKAAQQASPRQIDVADKTLVLEVPASAGAAARDARRNSCPGSSPALSMKASRHLLLSSLQPASTAPLRNQPWHCVCLPVQAGKAHLAPSRFPLGRRWTRKNPPKRKNRFSAKKQRISASFFAQNAEGARHAAGVAPPFDNLVRNDCAQDAPCWRAS